MWRYMRAQAVGTSHLRAKMPCQDRLACELLADGSLIAALSDGAGSAARAERGAEIAVGTIIDYLKLGLAQERTDFIPLLREAAVTARDSIEAEADREGVPLRHYACTLLSIVLTSRGGAALQLGDGVIVVGTGEGEWAWMFWPQRGEFANATFFLTDEGSYNRFEIDTIDSFVTDVALMSDGLEPLALQYASQVVYNPFFKGMFRPLLAAKGCGEITLLSDSLKQFLSSERVGSRTDDDVSLILATRREPERSSDES
jgi:hypothetical protein